MPASGVGWYPPAFISPALSRYRSHHAERPTPITNRRLTERKLWSNGNCNRVDTRRTAPFSARGYGYIAGVTGPLDGGEGGGPPPLLKPPAAAIPPTTPPPMIPTPPREAAAIAAALRPPAVAPVPIAASELAANAASPHGTVVLSPEWSTTIGDDGLARLLTATIP